MVQEGVVGRVVMEERGIGEINLSLPAAHPPPILKLRRSATYNAKRPRKIIIFFVSLKVHYKTKMQQTWKPPPKKQNIEICHIFTSEGDIYMRPKKNVAGKSPIKLTLNPIQTRHEKTSDSSPLYRKDPGKEANVKY